MRIRSKTVEPVLGTLMNFLNMRRVNTRGIEQANKHVLMAALTYNLKKYLKFIHKKATAQVAALNKDTQKGIERQIFGFVEGHIDIENLQRQFFSKNERFFKTYGLKLSNWLF